MDKNKNRRLNVLVRLSSDLQFCSLEHIEKVIATAKQRAAAEGITNITLEVEQNYGYGDDDGISVDVYLKGWRDETDEEMTMRIKREEYESQRSKEVEYASYIRLKKKFENV